MLLPRVLGLVQSCRWEEDDYVETLTSHLHFSKPSEFYAWRSNAKSKSIHITVNFPAQNKRYFFIYTFLVKLGFLFLTFNSQLHNSELLI